MVSLIFWWLWLWPALLRSSFDTCSKPSISRFNCVTISVASFRLSPSAVYLKNMQHGIDNADAFMHLNNRNAKPPPSMTLVPFASFHCSQSLHRSKVDLYCSAKRSLAIYRNFDASIVCCSCENIPVRMIICCTCCSDKNLKSSLKNAINCAPLAGGERNWKHAKRFSEQTNSSHAVDIWFDGEFASFDMIWCWNARGPNIGIIACCSRWKKGAIHRLAIGKVCWYFDQKQRKTDPPQKQSTWGESVAFSTQY